VYEDGWEIEMLGIIGNVLNMSLDIANGANVMDLMLEDKNIYMEKHKGNPLMFIGGIVGVKPELDYFCEYAPSYLTVRLAWYTPCTIKYRLWSRFFNIFSVYMWICFTWSRLLAIITVRYISNYGHKSHLHESSSYSNIFSVTTNIIAVSLSVPVNKQPRSRPLRLFFFCWVCYSVAISTVFQAYLTTFIVEPGYVEPIRSVEQMLQSEMNFCLYNDSKSVLTDTSDHVHSEIVKNALECPDDETCLKWATVYHNISFIISDFVLEIDRNRRKLRDENNRPIICELENGVVVGTLNVAIMVSKRSPLFDIINDVIVHIIEGGIFVHIKNRGIYKENLETMYEFLSLDDTTFAISIRHLQTAFYLLLLGYVLAVVCFVTEIMWHCYSSNGRRQKRASSC
jgi:hypothetical protein